MMPSTLLNQLKSEDFWKNKCIHSGELGGIEAEHAIFYAGKAIQERWAIVPVAKRFNRNPSSNIKERSAIYAMRQCKRLGLWNYIKIKYPKKSWDKDFTLLSKKHK